MAMQRTLGKRPPFESSILRYVVYLYVLKPWLKKIIVHDFILSHVFIHTFTDIEIRPYIFLREAFFTTTSQIDRILSIPNPHNKSTIILFLN